MNKVLVFFEELIFKLKSEGNYRKEEVFAKKLNTSFASNDYLGLSENKKVKSVAIKGVKKYGTGGRSSKFIMGFNELYEQIREKMKEMKKVEDCLIFSSGYLCNIGIFSALASKGDIIFVDEFSHSSTFTGALLSGAKIMRYKHNNINDLEKKLETFASKDFANQKGKIFIATETVFSMKGTKLESPDEYVSLAKKYNAILVTDEAHSFGVFEFNFPKYELHLQMGTFSKAIGALGGYVCGNSILIDVIRNLAKTGIYTTALPPSVLSSILTSLKLISSGKVKADKALLNAKLFSELTGFPFHSQIVFLECKSSEEALNFSQKFSENGFLIKAIRKPTVETPGLRISFNNLNKKVDIIKLSFIVNNLFNIKL